MPLMCESVSEGLGTPWPVTKHPALNFRDTDFQSIYLDTRTQYSCDISNNNALRLENLLSELSFVFDTLSTTSVQ